MGTRIGFLIDLRLFERAGALAAEVPMVRFALGFREHFDEVVLIARVFPRSSEDAPYPIPDEGVRVVPLPPYRRISSLYIQPFRYWPAIDRALRATLPDLDALWLNFGHPVSSRALALSEAHPRLRPFAVIRGAYDRDAALRTSGPALARRLAGGVMRLEMRRFARRAARRRLPCFAFGAEMTGWLRQRGLEVDDMVSSLLTEQDLHAGAQPREELAADLLAVGRLEPEKGVDVLLDALPGLETPEGRPATLRLVGSGRCEAELRAQAERLRIAPRVRFDGHVPFGPELFARYASARLVVIPSRTEGVPKAAYEAMAFGRPVLATRVGGLPAALADGRGVLVAPDDPAALREAAARLLADPERLEALRARATSFGRQVTLESQIRRIVSRVMGTPAGGAR
jgi:glycosyltransferase involved in cell wall biosynthesis